MVSAFLGGLASGAERGMDIRAARESKAADTAIKLSEAAKDRAIKQKSVDATIENTKTQIASMKLQRDITTVTQAIAKADQLSLKGAPPTKISDLPAAIQQAFKNVGHTGEFIGQGGVASYNQKATDATVQMVLNGTAPMPQAGTPVAQRVQQMLNVPNYIEAQAIVGKKFNTVRARDNGILIHNANRANNPELTGITFVPTLDKNGTPVHGSMSKMPVNDNAYWQLSGFASSKEEAKALNNMKVGKEKYLALAKLTYWSKRLKEGKKDSAQYNHDKRFIQNNLADAYNTVFQDMTKKGGLNLLAVSSIKKKGAIEFHAQNYDDLDNIAQVLKEGNKNSKLVTDAKSSSSLSNEEIMQAVINSGYTNIKNEDQFVQALQERSITVTQEQRGDAPAAATNTQEVLNTGPSGQQTNKSVLVVTVKPDAGSNVSILGDVPLSSIGNVVESYDIPVVSTFNGKQITMSPSENIADNPEFEDAVTLHMHAKSFAANGKAGTDFWHNNVMNRADGDKTLFNQYERYTRANLYTLLEEVSSNQAPASSVEKLREVIKNNFDFSDSKILDKDKAIDTAVMNAVLTVAKYKSASKPTFKYRNGKLVQIRTTVSQRSVDDYTAADKKLASQMATQAQKLGVSMELLEGYESDVNKIDEIIKLEDTNSTAEVIAKALDFMEGQREFKRGSSAYLKTIGVNPSKWAALKQEASRLLIQGSPSVSDLSATKNRIIQQFRDYITVAKEVLTTDLFDINTVRDRSEMRNGLQMFKGRAEDFRSANDTDKDWMTQNTLKIVREQASKRGKAFKDKIEKLQREEEAAPDKRTKALKRAAIYKEYLQARLYSNRISLTYYYAGLVQGESGGRAISNEDFQVLFRALWQEGRAGSVGIAGVSIMRDVITGLKEKNMITQQYIGIGTGTLAADVAYRTKTILDRARYKNREGKTLYSQRGRPLPALAEGVTTPVMADTPPQSVFAKKNTSRTYDNKEWRQTYTNTMQRVTQDLAENVGIRRISENFVKPWESLTDGERMNITRSVIGNTASMLDTPFSGTGVKPLFVFNTLSSDNNRNSKGLGDVIKLALASLSANTGARATTVTEAQNQAAAIETDKRVIDTALDFTKFIYGQLFSRAKRSQR